VRDGAEAISYLSGESKYRDRVEFPMPSIVLLDLNMPMWMDSRVLRWIGKQPGLKRLLVIVLNGIEDVKRLTRPTSLAPIRISQNRPISTIWRIWSIFFVVIGPLRIAHPKSLKPGLGHKNGRPPGLFRPPQYSVAIIRELSKLHQDGGTREHSHRK